MRINQVMLGHSNLRLLKLLENVAHLRVQQAGLEVRVGPVVAPAARDGHALRADTKVHAVPSVEDGQPLAFRLRAGEGLADSRDGRDDGRVAVEPLGLVSISLHIYI